MLSHPAVHDARVTSKDSEHGDLLVGIVQVKCGQNFESDELVSYVNGNIQCSKMDSIKFISFGNDGEIYLQIE